MKQPNKKELEYALSRYIKPEYAVKTFDIVQDQHGENLLSFFRL